MGYLLNSLANLPVDEDVNFYIFVINGQWQEPLYEMMERNFSQVAKSIGNNAVIAKGLDPKGFCGEVEEKYFGSEAARLFPLLPALLITDAHPDEIDDESLRLIVPLKEAEERFGGWPQFFSQLSDFVQHRDDEFVKRFSKLEDAFDAADRLIEFKPGIFGVSLNVNEIYRWWRKRDAPSRGL